MGAVSSKCPGSDRRRRVTDRCAKRRLSRRYRDRMPTDHGLLRNGYRSSTKISAPRLQRSSPPRQRTHEAPAFSLVVWNLAGCWSPGDVIRPPTAKVFSDVLRYPTFYLQICLQLVNRRHRHQFVGGACGTPIRKYFNPDSTGPSDFIKVGSLFLRVSAHRLPCIGHRPWLWSAPARRPLKTAGC